MSDYQWMEDERVSQIPKSKLLFLQKIFFETKQLTQKEQLPFFMALASRAKKENISFSQEEINTIMDAIKEYSTPEEIQKINQAIRLFQNRKK